MSPYGSFTFSDFADNLRKLKKLGSMKDLMKMVPGIGAHVDNLGFEEDDLVKVEAIINSMTLKERSRPEILNTSRRDRIARGSGTSRVDVDDLIKQFGIMKRSLLMKPYRFFTFCHFADDLRRLKSFGGMKGPTSSVPGVGRELDLEFWRDELPAVEAIISSMTPKERRCPQILGSGRRDRIARGSGTCRLYVDLLIRDFADFLAMREMMLDPWFRQPASSGGGPAGPVNTESPGPANLCLSTFDSWGPFG
jgi:signal recognition particle GTPase